MGLGKSIMDPLGEDPILENDGVKDLEMEPSYDGLGLYKEAHKVATDANVVWPMDITSWGDAEYINQMVLKAPIKQLKEKSLVDLGFPFRATRFVGRRGRRGSVDVKKKGSSQSSSLSSTNFRVGN